MPSEFPRARSSRLLVEELDGDLIVYDQDTDTAHVLSDVVARVWQRCDGESDPVCIAQDLSLDSRMTSTALQELQACGLLTSAVTTSAGYSRRDAVKKVAKVGAAAASVPLIYSLAIAPSAAMATPIGCATQVCGGLLVGAAAADNQCRTPAAIAAGCQLGSTCAGDIPFLTPGTCAF